MDYTSIKVGQLPTEEISGSDFIPHEVNGLLKKATITDLAAFIGANDAVGFRAVSVPNGGTLPTTDTQEFILVGPGTYNNVGGGSTITVTEELNALVSNGTYWFVGVEIPIDAPPGNAVWGEIVGTLSNQTDLQSLLNLKADLVAGKVPSSQLPSYVDDVVEVADFAALPVSGETGKIYVTLDSGFIYRWTGTIYVRIADEAAAWGTITGTLSDQTDLQSALNLRVPYTGATGNVDLGSHKLSASDLVVNHASGSGVAASITKGGNGEALTVVKSSGTGNAASITGGTTLISELNLTTDLADAYIASAATWNAKQNALSGTGFVKISGSTISYDNSTYALDSVVVKLTGDQNIRGVKSFLGNQTASTLKLVLADYFNDGFITSDNGMLRLLNGSTELFNLDSTGIVKGASYQLNGGTGNALYYGHTNKVVLANYTVGGGIDFETNGGNINMILNGNGNLGIGVDPSAWDTAWKVLQLSYGSLYSSIYSNIMAHNLYVAGEDTKYISSNLASQYEQNSGAHWWSTAPTGTAGANVTLTPRMILTNDGKLGIGIASPNGKLNVSNNGAEGLEFWTATTTATNMIQSYNRATSAFNNIRYEGLDHIFSSSGTERMRINSEGNVGIGIVPQWSLATYRSLEIGLTGLIYARTTSDSGTMTVGSNLYYNSGWKYKVNGGGSLIGQNDGNITFETAPSGTANSAASITERMRITSGGNVGIGNGANVNSRLHVEGQDIYLTGALDNRIRFSNFGFTGNSMGAAIGYVYGVANTQEQGNLAFYTNPNTTGTPSLTERMRIDSNGTALFKRTSSLDPSYAAGFEGAIFFKCAVNGNNTVNFFNASTTYVASIVTNASSITYGTGSDYRLKEDLKDFNGLEKVSKIKVYDFKFIKEGDRMEGVLAHELQEVIPYAVTGEKDELDEKGNIKIQNVDYSKLTPILVKAIQELKAEIEILKLNK